jgi:hypothetical protein
MVEEWKGRAGRRSGQLQASRRPGQGEGSCFPRRSQWVLHCPTLKSLSPGQVPIHPRAMSRCGIRAKAHASSWCPNPRPSTDLFVLQCVGFPFAVLGPGEPFGLGIAHHPLRGHLPVHLAKCPQGALGAPPPPSLSVPTFDFSWEQIPALPPTGSVSPCASASLSMTRNH